MQKMVWHMKGREVVYFLMQNGYLDKRKYGNKPGLAYQEVKEVIESRLNFTKRNLLTEQEVKEAACELRDSRGEDELDKDIVITEVERIYQKLAIY